jgi:hypothetical protein
MKTEYSLVVNGFNISKLSATTYLGAVRCAKKLMQSDKIALGTFGGKSVETICIYHRDNGQNRIATFNGKKFIAE